MFLSLKIGLRYIMSFHKSYELILIITGNKSIKRYYTKKIKLYN